MGSDKGSNNKPLETDIGKKHALKKYNQFSLPDQIGITSKNAISRNIFLFFL